MKIFCYLIVFDDITINYVICENREIADKLFDLEMEALKQICVDEGMERGTISYSFSWERDFDLGISFIVKDEKYKTKNQKYEITKSNDKYQLVIDSGMDECYNTYMEQNKIHCEHGDAYDFIKYIFNK